MKCIHCQQDTTNPRFCSRSCAATWNNIASPKRKTQRKCADCSNYVPKWNMTRCGDCQKLYHDSQYKSKTLAEYYELPSIKDKPPSWKAAHVRHFARRWLKHLTLLPCRHCGYKKHVELCHVKAVSEFPSTALLSEVHSETNVIQLCPNCHWEFDHLPRSSSKNQQ
jgi:hypothetical protein